MWSYLSLGAVLGLSAGVSPGPLLAVIIAQTLQHNVREGMKVAVAPLLTDLPIILLGILFFTNLPEPNFALGIMSFVGSVFVIYLGWSSLRQQAVNLDIPEGPPRSYWKGALVNLLSPHPYLFWFALGVPTIVKAQAESIFGAIGFVVAFFGLMIGAKIGIALMVGKSRRFLSSGAYIWLMRGLGVALILFGVVLFYDGLVLTGVVV